MSRPPATRIDALFTGRAWPLGPEGQRSAIVKSAAAGPVVLTARGLVGDEQADRRVHGGPDKAVHHFAAEGYAVLRAAHPAAPVPFEPGTIGENLSTRGLTEENVCIGDVYRVGECLLQVSQPRSPCWKIDHRFGLPGLSRLVQERRITGWYYRVLEPGRLEAGCAVALVERGAVAVTVRGFWDAYLQHRPEPGALERLLAAAGLNEAWRARIGARLAWLARHGDKR